MARTVLVDAGYLVAVLSRRDFHHQWAVQQASAYPPTWHTCEAVLSEAYFLLEKQGAPGLSAMLLRRVLVADFNLDSNLEPVATLLRKYANILMSFADACLVRMSETFADPLILTTDSDFKIYRRHSRHVVPCVMPS